jgi:glutathione S-transferase
MTSTESSAPSASPPLVLVGRSSSVFTRVARVFAAELDVAYRYQIVPDLMSSDVEDYGGNPALKLPSLRTPHALWFGSLNICRELARWSNGNLDIVWPEQLTAPLLANAQELVLQALSTEVSLIMSKISDVSQQRPHQLKMLHSLRNVMSWLDLHAQDLLAALPEQRHLSYLEVTLFCLLTHLEFREVVPVAPYAALDEFRQRFAQRPACAESAFRFDT